MGDDSTGSVKSYSCDDITKLEGLQAIREVPGMYVGDVHDGSGLHHVLEGAITLAVNEHLAGRCTRVAVTLRSDGGAEVRTDGQEVVEPAASWAACPGLALFTGYDRSHRGEGNGPFRYGFSERFDLAINALAERFTADFPHRGRRWSLAFERGRLVSSRSVEDVGDPSDTVLCFKPDPSIFTDPRFSFTVLESFLRVLAYVLPSMTFSLCEQESGRACSFPTAGVVDYARSMSWGYRDVTTAPIGLHGEQSAAAGPAMRVDIALQWTSSGATNIGGLVNGVYNRDEGTHVNGLRRALAGCLTVYAIEAGLMGRRKGRDFSIREVREGLTAVVSLWHHAPVMVSGGSKRWLVSPEAEPFVAQVVNRQLFAWLKAHPSEAHAIIEHISRPSD